MGTISATRLHTQPTVGLTIQVDIPSTRQQPAATSKSTATDPLQVDDAEIQTCERYDVAVQTHSSSTSSLGSKDAKSLATFLGSIEPFVLAELSANIEQHAAPSVVSRKSAAQVCSRCCHECLSSPLSMCIP